MIFNCDLSEFKILDVLRVKRDGKTKIGFNKNSKCSYFSCRISGNSDIEYSDRIVHLDTEHYLICPSGVKYTHHYYEEEVIIIHLDFTLHPPKEIESIYNNSPILKEYFIQLHKYWTEKQSGYICKCKAILYEIFYLLSISDCQLMNSKIEKSMEFLYKHYLDHDFNISKMIACSYMSEAYFRRIFRKLYDCSIVEFLNRQRVAYAKSLIESHLYSISEIASMSGFDDEKYFSQVFRKITGYSPSKFNSLY